MRGRMPKVGTYLGTGAALTVTLDFEPLAVIIYNETDGDVAWIAINGVAAGKGLQIANHDTAQLSFLSANGITIGPRGFIAGTTCSESAKTMRYVAF